MKIMLIVCLCLMSVFGLLLVAQSFAQEGSNQTVEVSGYSFNTNTVNMSPVDYGVVVSKRFIDEDNAAYFLDPSGLSMLRNLEVTDEIKFEADLYNYNLFTGAERQFRITNLGSTYYMNFDDGGVDPGFAKFHHLRAFKFYMDDPGPLDWNAERGGGKYVYDIAESVLVAEGEPGDVVVISSDTDITVVRSKKKFDTAVAGVISTEPKIYMGYSPDTEKEGKYKPLALAGIVLCKVSAENGAIKKGDILVSSSVPGHAMRADPQQLTPGMMLGSALENWDQGEGKIYILVN